LFQAITKYVIISWYF